MTIKLQMLLVENLSISLGFECFDNVLFVFLIDLM